MRTIWKFPIQVTDTQTVDLPLGSRVLSTQIQGHTLCLWVEVSPKQPIQTRTVRVIGTGSTVAFNGRYLFIGTVLDGPFVWHIYVEDER